MIGRVTNRSTAMSSLAALQAAQQRSNKLQQQATSGNALTKPSDDPVATSSAMQYRTQLAIDERYSRANADGTAWLDQQDKLLQTVSERLAYLNGKAVQGANSGSQDQNSLNAIAAEVDSIKSEFLGIANTQFLGRPLFGGTTDQAQAFVQHATTKVVTYSGNSDSITRDVAPGTTVAVNLPGNSVFGANGSNIFDTLDKFAARLRGTAPAGEKISDSITELTNSTQPVHTALASMGARGNQLRNIQTSTDARLDATTDALEGVETVDIAKVLMEYKLQETAYQTALYASAKVIQPTLLEFLS